jgi:hypothetical protein
MRVKHGTKLLLLGQRAGIHGARITCSGSKDPLLYSIPVILDAFYQATLHTEIHLLIHHGGQKVQRGSPFQNEIMKQNRIGRVSCSTPKNERCVS